MKLQAKISEHMQMNILILEQMFFLEVILICTLDVDKK